MFFVTGDIHGNAWDLDDRLDQLVATLGRPLGRDDEILLLGDVGLRYGAVEAPEILSVMREYGATFVVMRGNHDVRYCRDFRDGMYGNGFHSVMWRGGEAIVDDFVGNVLYLPDEGGYYPNGGHPFLVIPGAFSVDGYYRQRMFMPFEREEQLTSAEMDRLVGFSEEMPIEYVFSHTCPYGWLDRISDLFLTGVRQESVDKGMERMMDVILENVSDSLRGWWFGHYHDDRAVPDSVGHMLFYSVVEVPGI
jgi:3-oxoacid CoA-transferase subunit A